MKKGRILFIIHHRKDRSPGQRFRHEQYLDALEAAGFECVLSPLMDAEEDKGFYAKGNLLGKFRILLSTIKKRLRDVKRAKDFDIIYIFREAFMTGSIYFEKQFKKSGAKLIFDYDDSIWIDNISEGNKMFAFLKNAQKTSDIIALCDLIMAGNPYLADYARSYNSNITIVPTTIDTQEYKRIPAPKSDVVTIGWSGSITTIQHFEHALPFLKVIKQKYGEKIAIKVIGDGNYVNAELGVKGLAWKKEDELKELSTFDIGIMPLPDDKWAKGKCGLKGLQYMALSIPTIMSPVGVNQEIIQHGVNGFLATTTEEWVAAIETLLGNESLRLQVGAAGRKTVEDHYSVNAWRDKYVALYKSLLAK
ncbi:MAG: glycosyltransferase family 4 protein [Chitinophagales bacterium]